MNWSDRFIETCYAGLISVVLTVIPYYLAVEYGWSTEPPSYLEIGGVFFNFLCVILTTRRNIWNWPFGAIAVVLLGVLFWQLELYASFVLHIVYFLPMQVWGWVNWAFGDKDMKLSLERYDQLPITSMSMKEWLFAGFTMVIAWIALSKLNEHFGAALPWLDTAILVLSVVAQYLLTFKKWESWVLWTVVNVIAVYVYWNSDLNILAVQYGLFLVNSLYGLFDWRFMERLRNWQG